MDDYIKFNDKINCYTCKHGYFKDFSWDGWHNLCGAYHCYLCAENYGECDDYEEGIPPEGAEPM